MTKKPAEHLCSAIHTISARVDGDMVIMHVGALVSGAPGCIEVKMCAEYAVQLSAILQYHAVDAMRPVFGNGPELAEFMDALADDAAELVLRAKGRPW